jgi:HD-GYP domain-containing protein (c-di-GMP phosphodiesterase class II)/DNA-binding CsgD family transcriptional regulator
MAQTGLGIDRSGSASPSAAGCPADIPPSSDSSGVRRGELAAAISLATDLAMGQPMEHGLRTCLLAVQFGRRAGLSEAELVDVYYLALLRWLGATAETPLVAAWFGDEIVARGRSLTIDFGSRWEVVGDMIRFGGEGQRPGRRLETTVGAIAGGHRAVDRIFEASCEVAQRLARRLGVRPSITAGLGQVFERWDGRGRPQGVRGEELTLPARVVQLAHDADVFHRIGRVEAVHDVLERRAGHMYDPELARRFARDARAVFLELDRIAIWDAVLDSEAGTQPVLSEVEFDTGLTVIADFADLKSPYMTGHSRGVAALGESAVLAAGLSTEVGILTRRAGLVHDIGRTGIPSGIWDKEGALSELEVERVRFHPYLTERVLARPDALAELGALAGLHHERMDGSGYHRGVPGVAQPAAAPILAVADAYHAMTERRPHRDAISPQASADQLRLEVGAGRLSGDAVDAVLAAAAVGGGRPRSGPADLGEDELDLLRLVTRGASTEEMAAALTMSERAAASHVERLYGKLGVTTRAAATLFAMEKSVFVTPV